MATTFQDAYTKFQVISNSTNSTVLTQAKQDINIGYKRFDAAISRYFTRKQLFTNLVSGQRYYQVPVDTIRVSEVSVLWSSGYEYRLNQVRSESDWRNMLIPTGFTGLPSNYFVYGNDQIGLYPIPSQSVTNGLRFVYQPQDIDLTQDDYTTGTITITNGSTSVTGSGTVWTAQMASRMFEVTDGSDGNWYEIASVTNNTTLVLKTPYVGISTSGAAYKIGQVFIFPSEYDDVPVDYALSRFYESRNNPNRAKYHLDKYTQAVEDAVRRYSSSSTSHVITDDAPLYPQNIWQWPPTAS